MSLILFSCKSDDDRPILCTEEFVFGLSIEVLNADTNEPVVEGITVTARDGMYTEELQLTSDFQFYYGAGERAGNYIITISGDGYNEFTSEMIAVSADECHVITEFRSYSIQPN
jgi:hypothetical protein